MSSTLISHQLPATSHRFLSRVLFSVLCALCAVLSIHAESPESLYAIGTDAYKAKNYDQSIGAYEKLLSQGYHNAGVYYNLGNAYYKSDKISQAILNYERALRLAPSDEDIRFNLKVANLKTVDRITPVPQLLIITKWDSFVSSESSGTWAVISLACIWLALIAFAVYLFFGSVRRPGFYVGLVLILFSIFFFYISWSQSRVEFGGGQAILTASNTYMKSAPDASGTDLFMIHEGIKLNILDKVGDWAKVRLADGKVGWVEHGTFTVI